MKIKKGKILMINNDGTYKLINGKSPCMLLIDGVVSLQLSKILTLIKKIEK